MPSFEYYALDVSGKRHRGYIDADSERHARQKLRDKKYLPAKVALVKPHSTRTKLFSSSVSAYHLALFTQQFSVLLQSGLAVEDALQATSEQTENKTLKSALRSIKAKVREGHRIAEGMREYPSIFPVVYTELIAAGEKSGELSLVLMQLADYTERSERLKNTILQAAIYPLVLTAVALSVITLLMTYVVPKVVEQFDHVGQQLPLITRVMIATSHFMVEQGGWLLLGGLVVIASGIYGYRQPNIKMKVHRLLFSAPLLSRIVKNLETARVLNTLSIMVSSGVPLLDALTTSVKTTKNHYFQNLLQDICEMVREGAALNKAMQKVGVFQPMTVYMIANGEMSGELAIALKKSAEQQENQLNNVIGIATRLLEPVLIIVFGMIVLSIVLAILLPIIQLNNLTRI